MPLLETLGVSITVCVLEMVARVLLKDQEKNPTIRRCFQKRKESKKEGDGASCPMQGDRAGCNGQSLPRSMALESL